MVEFSATSDLDPRDGYYWVNLAWGHNVMKTADGAMMLDEGSFITGYGVNIVDQYGTVLETTTVDVPAMGGMVSCCSANQYITSVSGKIPAAASAAISFMIVPYHGSGDTKVMLPIGTMTSALVDVQTGSATEVEQSVSLKGMTQADAIAFTTSAAAKGVMVTSIVASFADSKITAQNVIITKLEAKETATRRLGEGRRLSGWQVDCNYKILLPADYTGQITKDSVNVETLKNTVVSEYQEETGNTITVGTVDVSEPVTTTVTDAGATTGAAHRTMGHCLLSFFALALALAGQQRLA
jgi:hypothetical protein